MKLNERNLVHYATCKSPVDKSGFLLKKGDRNTTYYRRWCVLKGNILFYFDNEESKDPVGAIVLEGCRVELCDSSEEFAFAIKFASTKSRPYMLVADSQNAMESWVKALSRANFEYIRLVVTELQKQLDEIQNGTNYFNIQAIKENDLYNSKYNNLHQHLYPNPSDKLPCIEPKYDNWVTWKNARCEAANGSDKNSDLVSNPSSDSEGNGQKVSLTSEKLLPKSGEGESCSYSLQSTQSPIFGSFVQLHNFFGEEIVELRDKWTEPPQSVVTQTVVFGLSE
ncbi:hypothetical protein GDO86_009824 [Hymenochirus boettgeri]|uniref:Sesquipedalian n=1 Tax=Hymenochirus boettgeri TaxID=247094 RepID=A0A8T2JN01_9PIPI|nr:hypothetical protein GDO86_009824 [Hymenochirus boettgeri]